MVGDDRLDASLAVVQAVVLVRPFNVRDSVHCMFLFADHEAVEFERRVDMYDGVTAALVTVSLATSPELTMALQPKIKKLIGNNGNH